MTGPFPTAVAHLPVCPRRGLPIPFSAARDGDVGVFAITDSLTIERCHAERLCGVCGKPLGYWICFLGGSRSAEQNGAYTDPPMHPACAEAAIELCPYIAREKVPRRTDSINLGRAMAIPHGETPGKSGDWMLVTCRQYKSWLELAQNHAPVRVYQPAGGKRFYRRFVYAGGKLTEVNEGNTS